MATPLTLTQLQGLGLPICTPGCKPPQTCSGDISAASAAAKPFKAEDKVPAKTQAPRDMAPANALAPAVAQQLSGAGQKTVPLWLEDTYCFAGKAKLCSATILEGGKLRVILDQTIFHPQGGGQPTDVGQMKAAGLPCLQVTMVSLDKESGSVFHDCLGDSLEQWAAASTGLHVDLCVDEATRRTNARCHSAGHFLDAAVSSAGFEWKPGKGYHFSDGAYVEYVMTAEQKAAVDKDKALAAISEAVKRLLATPTAVKVELRDGVRTVEIEETACPCGGTHVKNTSELGEVTVKALKAKGTNMRVSYVVSS